MHGIKYTLDTVHGYRYLALIISTILLLYIYPSIIRLVSAPFQYNQFRRFTEPDTTTSA